MPTIPRKLSITNVSRDVINAILNEGNSINYRDYIPFTATDADSIRAIGKIIMDSPNLRNSFASDLINRLILTIVTSKMYDNPWARFKKGKLDMGEMVEEIFVNIAKAELYNPSTAKDTVFKRRIPDIRAAFHVVNSQIKYPVTIGNEELSAAFTTENGLYNLIEKIYETLYTADHYDEYNIMKYLLAHHILAGHVKAIPVVPIVTEGDVKATARVIKATSNNLTFMTDDFNIAGVKTHVQHKDQTLIISTDFDAAMDVDVLAYAFNMERAEFLSRRMLVDGFGNIDVVRLAECCPELCTNIVYDDDGAVVSAEIIGMTANDLRLLNEIPAVLIDDAWMQIYDRLITMEDIRNPDGLYTNAFLHVWKIYSVSPFAPAAMFTSATSTVNAVNINPLTAKVFKGGSVVFTASVDSSGFVDRSVTWSIEGGVDGTSISNTGVVTVSPDETATTITVRATSNADTNISATAEVTIYDNTKSYKGEIKVSGGA